MLTKRKRKSTHYRHVMDVQRRRAAVNGWQSQGRPWDRVAVLKCKRAPMKASEREVASSQTTIQRHIVEARWQPGLLTTDRLRDRETGELFAIESVENVDDESRYMRIVATIANHEE